MNRKIAVIGLPFYAERSARSLRELGYPASYVPRPGRDPRSWAVLGKGVLSARLVYTIGSSIARNSPADLIARTGKRVLMHWVGTDVQAARADHAAGRVSRRLVRNATHWVDAPWLADELAPLGIRAECHTLPIETTIGSVLPLPPEFRVIVYLPAGKHAAYDIEATLAVFTALPEVRFTLIGGHPAPAGLSNVESLGYVTDMPAVYRDAVAMLRLVHHDGMSHSVIEALSFGRYVVWSYPFEGAIHASSAEAATAAIRDLHARFTEAKLGPNDSGAESVTQKYRWCTLQNEIRAGMDPLLS